MTDNIGGSLVGSREIFPYSQPPKGIGEHRPTKPFGL